MVEQQLNEQDEAEEILNILCAMSQNVYREGVSDWEADKLRVVFQIVQPWLQAKVHAARLYGETGAAAWEYAHNALKNNMLFESTMMRLDA